MTRTTKERWLNYAIPLVVVFLALAVLVTSRWHSRDRYVVPESFAGCYRDGAGSILKLESTGALRSAGALAGKYRIVSPVGGKHGYLVEASNVNVGLKNDKIIAESGTGGFFWPISEQGEMIVTFAPDTQRVLRRETC